MPNGGALPSSFGIRISLLIHSFTHSSFPRHAALALSTGLPHLPRPPANGGVAKWEGRALQKPYERVRLPPPPPIARPEGAILSEKRAAGETPKALECGEHRRSRIVTGPQPPRAGILPALQSLRLLRARGFCSQYRFHKSSFPCPSVYSVDDQKSPAS